MGHAAFEFGGRGQIRGTGPDSNSKFEGRMFRDFSSPTQTPHAPSLMPGTWHCVVDAGCRGLDGGCDFNFRRLRHLGLDAGGRSAAFIIGMHPLLLMESGSAACCTWPLREEHRDDHDATRALSKAVTAAAASSGCCQRPLPEAAATSRDRSRAVVIWLHPSPGQARAM